MNPSKILILLALLCSALPAAAAPKDDLRQVQRAIGESNRKLQQQQSEQRQLQSNIRQTQSELDTVRRELDRLTRSRQSGCVRYASREGPRNKGSIHVKYISS